MKAPPNVIHRRASDLGTLFVVDHHDLRHLRIGSEDGMEQSVVSLVNPEHVHVEYVREAFLALAFIELPKRLLMIGLGGGVFSSRLRQAFPKTRIDAVDISPDIVDVAKTYFGVCEDTYMRIHVEDGQAFVTRTRHTYDLALLDAYSGTGVPEHLSTPEFFSSVSRRVSPNGMAILNIAIDDAPAEHALIRGFRATFPHTASLRTPTDDNILIFGSHSPLTSAVEVQLRAKQLTRELGLSWKLQAIAARLDYTCKSAFTVPET